VIISGRALQYTGPIRAEFRVREVQTWQSPSERKQQIEKFKSELAYLVALCAVDAAPMPQLHIGRIQTSGVAYIRWPARDVCIAAFSLHLVLATVLLVHLSRCRGRIRNLFHRSEEFRADEQTYSWQNQEYFGRSLSESNLKIDCDKFAGASTESPPYTLDSRTGTFSGVPESVLPNN
jgi:hypothetical protein